MMKGVFVMVIKIWDSLIDCGYFINFFMNWNYGVVILIIIVKKEVYKLII